jgi:hypothetical protein
MGENIVCAICDKREVHLFFISLSDRYKHISEHHIDTPIKWTRIECKKGFPKLQDATYPNVEALRKLARVDLGVTVAP